MSEIRVRMAPSPSGFLHVGTARTTIYNWLFARHNRGKFVLRIEDTDTARSSREMIDAILDGIKWLGLDWDEGPYYQSERTKLYQDYARKLLETKKAYYCFCSPQELEDKRKQVVAAKGEWKYDRVCYNLSDREKEERIETSIPKAVRLFVPEGETIFSDIVYRELKKENKDLDDLVILRSDGTPTYNFACVVDDVEMRISHVIRGNDHIANTFKQVLIYKALGIIPPHFAHIPLILAKDKSKLSKRHGATSIGEFKEEGFLPEALANYITLLGWSPKEDREMLTIDQMIELFTLEEVNPANPVFDKEKLEWMNGEYIRSYNNEDLLDLIIPFLKKENLINDDIVNQRRGWLIGFVVLLKERCKTLKEFAEKGKYFFSFNYQYDPSAVKKLFNSPAAAKMLRTFWESLYPIDEFKKEKIEEFLRIQADKMQIKPSVLIHLVRLATTGVTGGPPLFDILESLDKEEVIKRIQKAEEFCRDNS